jgi:hypothetical protein
MIQTFSRICCEKWLTFMKLLKKFGRPAFASISLFPIPSIHRLLLLPTQIPPAAAAASGDLGHQQTKR